MHSATQHQMHNAAMQYALVQEERAARLRDARKRAGFEDATTAARRFGWKIPTYLAHENGSRGFKLDKARIYAKRFKVNLEWLLTGEGKPSSNGRAPLGGYVGTGAVIYPVNDPSFYEGIDEVELPPGVHDDYIAFKVRGESQYPVYRDGELIYVPRDGGSPDQYLNRECVVRLLDGQRLLKTLSRGSAPGRYTLLSFNAPASHDQEVEWASPVEWTRKP